MNVYYSPRCESVEVIPQVHAVRHTFRIPVAPRIAIDRFVYSYILCGETITLIDTGVAGCEAGIFDYIRSIGRVPSDIALIVLTHSHPDHIGAARAIRQATGCSIAAHPAERAWIEDVEIQHNERPVPGFMVLVGGSVRVDRELPGEDILTPEETGLQADMHVIHTPGHSPGSISLFMPDTGVLFSGDAVPVAGDIPVYDDVSALVQSIRRLQDIPGIRILLQSWDYPGRGEEAYRKMDRALAYLQAVHDAVLASASRGTSDMAKLTRDTAEALGLPPQAAGPLLARTFQANLKVKDRRTILAGTGAP